MVGPRNIGPQNETAKGSDQVSRPSVCLTYPERSVSIEIDWGHLGSIPDTPDVASLQTWLGCVRPRCLSMLYLPRYLRYLGTYGNEELFVVEVSVCNHPKRGNNIIEQYLTNPVAILYLEAKGP